MASIQKRGKTWQYTVSRTVNGKSKPIRKGGFRTKTEAKAAAAEMETEMRKGTIPDHTPVPFADYFRTWLQTYKCDAANATYERYENTLLKIEEYFKDTPIQQITKRTYQTFLNEYGNAHARSTAQKLNSHIRSCVKDAIDEGLIRVDFTRKAVITGDKPDKKPSEKHLHFQESEQLIGELFNRLDSSMTYYLLLLAITTGMRFGEIVGLTRKDFDFTTNTLNIDKTWGYTKRMHEGFGPTKNLQSVRVIRVDDKTMSAFQELFKTMPENIHKLVFYSPTSQYKVISNNAANKALKGILNSLDIEPVTVHELRHTHASISLYKEVSVQYVSERLGHGDLETTMNTYAHILKELRTRDEEKTAHIFDEMSG